MYYIYCYTNRINNHKYVGQTNNLKRRQREHKSSSFNSNSCSYNDLFHKKIREYGYENFDCEVLEKLYTSEISIVNEREQYWIEKLKTYCGYGQGYNMDLGGSQPAVENRKLTDRQVQEVKEKIRQGIPFIDLQKEYGVSATFLSNINHGIYFFEEDEEYPLYKYYKEDKDYDELIELLIDSDLSLAQIAKQLGMGYSTVKKINAGTLRKGLYPSYPIRKVTRFDKARIKEKKTKELLLSGLYSNREISEQVGYTPETVRQIKMGDLYYDPSLHYPLNNL